jgi:FixJ family two-component response regulator
MCRGTVILVDDDEPVRKALARLIRCAGYEVEALHDAEAFLSRDPVDTLACLVLDLRMPGMGGLELFHAIAGTSRALPIVFITGHGSEDVRVEAMAAGAVDVLDKPVDQAALLGAIDLALSHYARAAPP